MFGQCHFYLVLLRHHQPIIDRFILYARCLGVGVKTFHTFGMGEVEYTGGKVFVTVLCYIEDLMFQVFIFHGHYVACHKGVVLYVK